MERSRARRPHRWAIVAASVVVLVGIGLLITPWDGPLIVLAWVLIGIGVVVGALTLFLVRTPRS